MLVNEIDAWLPQTQCTRCGYPRCRDYAEALARGEAGINRCPPGGSVTLHALARLLDVPLQPLDPACGAEGPRTQAIIDETQCIGCRKCIDACPVDAIVGAPKLMHTVIAELCTGCELCVPPCPVDCIALVPQTVAGNPWKLYRSEDAARWRALNERRVQRLARRRKQTGFARRVTPSIEAQETERGRIRAEIRAAVARVRRKRKSY